MPHEHAPMTAEMEQCIQNCQDCHRVCLETIAHCLQMGGPHADPGHIKLMQDCVQICQTSADFMTRMSPHHPHVCRECSEICAECAKDCQSMGDDPMMKSCAEACRTCAESCRKMAA